MTSFNQFVKVYFNELFYSQLLSWPIHWLPNYLYALVCSDSFIPQEKDRNLQPIRFGLQPVIIEFFRMKRHVERFSYYLVALV